jgi:hypothetical protein
MEFHDDYPQYEMMAHHSEEEGKLKRRKLWNVFWIMLAVTIVELIIGSFAMKWGLLDDTRHSKVSLKLIFILLTIGKAFFIVFSFMHLGDEKKSFKYSIIGPYCVFIIYLIFLIIAEANYCKDHKNKMDELIVKQKETLNYNAIHGVKEAESEGTEPAAEGKKE